MEDYDKFSSFEEFYNSIDTGLDIVFSICGVKYNISWNNKPFICTCPNGVAVLFDSTQDLIAIKARFVYYWGIKVKQQKERCKITSFFFNTFYAGFLALSRLSIM